MFRNSETQSAPAPPGPLTKSVDDDNNIRVRNILQTRPAKTIETQRPSRGLRIPTTSTTDRSVARRFLRRDDGEGRGRIQT